MHGKPNHKIWTNGLFNKTYYQSIFIDINKERSHLIYLLPFMINPRSLVSSLLSAASILTKFNHYHCFQLNNINNNKRLKLFSTFSSFSNIDNNYNRYITNSMTSTTNNNDDSIMFQRNKSVPPPISTKVICTHSGTFQADEAMGCWMLRQLPEYYQSRIVRTRDDNIIPTYDIVLDVGGIYNHIQKRYDHHQRDYSEYFDYNTDDTTTSNRCTKLSASGLIYRHYGKDVILQHYPNISTDYLNIVYNKLYDTLLQALDAIDTGVELLPKDCDGIKLLYKDNTGLSSRVSRLNPRWNEEPVPNPDERFVNAMELCGNDFMSCLIQIVESDLPARMFVEDAIKKRYNIDISGHIIKFNNGGLPWLHHLYELEKQYNIINEILFVLYTDQQNMWRIQAVTKLGTKFTNRLDLPDTWKGLRDAELCTISGIAGCRFVHAAGFIGGNDTYEGALKMAQVTITQNNNK